MLFFVIEYLDYEAFKMRKFVMTGKNMETTEKMFEKHVKDVYEDNKPSYKISMSKTIL